MKETVIQIIGMVIAYVLYACIIMSNGFNWTSAIVGAELILVTVTTICINPKRCKK